MSRRKLKQELVGHFHSLDCEPLLDGEEYIDVDGLGLKVLHKIGITKTFAGTPIKQFDRLYQFTIKYAAASCSSNLTDTALLTELDIDKFLDTCQSMGLMVGLFHEEFKSVKDVLSYSRTMRVITSTFNAGNLHSNGKIRAGQPILTTYRSMRFMYSKKYMYNLMAEAIVSTNEFSMSFRTMM